MDFFKYLPDIIKAASAKDLGIVALCVIAISLLAYRFFRNAGPIIKIFVFVIMFFGCAGLVMALLKLKPTDAVCEKTHDEPFRPGDHKSGKDWGDCGGGTRCTGWLFSWTAPYAVTSVTCNPASYQKTLSQNYDGKVATCEGWINGGNEGVTMVVKWKEPCPAK